MPSSQALYLGLLEDRRKRQEMGQQQSIFKRLKMGQQHIIFMRGPDISMILEDSFVKIEMEERSRYKCQQQRYLGLIINIMGCDLLLGPGTIPFFRLPLIKI